MQITFELHAQGEKETNKKAAKASAAKSFMSKYRGYICCDDSFKLKTLFDSSLDLAHLPSSTLQTNNQPRLSYEQIMGNAGDYNIMSSTPDVPLATPLPPPHSCITTYHDDDVSAISMSSDLITDFSSSRSVVSTLQETVQKLTSGLTPEYSEILGGEPGEYCYVVRVRDLVRSFEGTSPTPSSKKSQSVEEAYAKLLPDLQEFLSDVNVCHALSTPPTRSASVTVEELLDRLPSLFKVDKPKLLTEEVNKLFTTTISLQITFELHAQGEKAMNKKAAKASAAKSFMSKYRGYI